MYGLLLESVQLFIEETFGVDIWQALLEYVEIKQHSFQTRSIYPESYIGRLVVGLSELLDLSPEEILFKNGQFFVSYISKFGYNKLLRVLGRNFTDFLKGLDNLHNHLRFSYPKIHPPSFVVLNFENDLTIRLKYTTKRKGYEHYVMGQLEAISNEFYSLKIKIKIESQIKDVDGLLIHTIFAIKRLDDEPWDFLKETFAGTSSSLKNFEEWDSINLKSSEFFEIFPFNLLIDDHMNLVSVGRGFNYLEKNLVHTNFKDSFIITRPFIEPNLDQILLYQNNMFEIVLISNGTENIDVAINNMQMARGQSLSESVLKFKGEMHYVKHWNKVLFLGTPQLNGPNRLHSIGLFLNDLNLYDSSREMIMVGDQQSDELKTSFEIQLKKCKEMEESLKSLDETRKQADALLYSCIPKSIAKNLCNGLNALETIKNFESVSICFTKVVDFAVICESTSVENVVALLNKMYSFYDNLTELHKVYKVETIGDSYMLVSGAPKKTEFHSAHILEMALDIIEVTEKELFWPSNPEKNLELYIGCHTGPIVAGIIGFKMPRYCLFGDTVNTASRMMSNGKANRIHISEPFAKSLQKYPYEMEYRGTMPIKGKGEMNTYFIVSRKKNFVYPDPITGEKRDFMKILEDDKANCYDDDDDDDDEGNCSSNSRVSSANLSITNEEFEEDEAIDAMEELAKKASRKMIANGEENITPVKKVIVRNLLTNKKLDTPETLNSVAKRLEFELENSIKSVNFSKSPEFFRSKSNDDYQDSVTPVASDNDIEMEDDLESVKDIFNKKTEQLTSSQNKNKKTSVLTKTNNRINGKITEYNIELFREYNESRRQNSHLTVLSETLTMALAEISLVRPADPVDYLATWLKNYTKS